jgi:hypothetical protein
VSTNLMPWPEYTGGYDSAGGWYGLEVGVLMAPRVYIGWDWNACFRVFCYCLFIRAVYVYVIVVAAGCRFLVGLETCL